MPGIPVSMIHLSSSLCLILTILRQFHVNMYCLAVFVRLYDIMESKCNHISGIYSNLRAILTSKSKPSLMLPTSLSPVSTVVIKRMFSSPADKAVLKVLVAKMIAVLNMDCRG